MRRSAAAELGFARSPVLGLPLGHGGQAVADQQSLSSRIGHPGRDADAVLRRGGHDPAMDVGSTVIASLGQGFRAA